jgi:hypothetical protein
MRSDAPRRRHHSSVVPLGITINPTLIANLSFDVERDFAPITILGTAANLFVVGQSLGIKTIPELIAKARQATMTYGTPGIGSQLHLAMELFKQRTGVEITHVPYRGMPPALADLCGAHRYPCQELPAFARLIRLKVPALRQPSAPLAPDIPPGRGGVGTTRDVSRAPAPRVDASSTGFCRDQRYPRISNVQKLKGAGS